MKIIGLTGGIASGKSTVSKILQELGAHIIDADRIARDIVMPGSEALAEIAAAFGENVLDSEGALKRKELACIVFNDADALRRLNGITHPRIVGQIKDRILRHSSPTDVIVLDAALLFELNLGFMVDETWLVWVDHETQVQRLTQRESMTREDAHKIIRAQLSLEEKMKAADRCIPNNGTLEMLKESVLKLWNEQVK